MSKLKLREQALGLRKKGHSYGQIKNVLGVSKGTLSVWLRNYPLSPERIQELRNRSEVRIEKFRKTMEMKRASRLAVCYKNEKAKILPLTKKEFFIAGLMLYWGEGGKDIQGSINISNTDPAVLKFMLRWFGKALKIPIKEVRVYLHLYNDMDKTQKLVFWSRALGLPISQFRKPYIKKTNRNRINHKGFGHGTCNLVVRNIRLKEKIMMAIKAIGDYYEIKK